MTFLKNYSNILKSCDLRDKLQYVTPSSETPAEKRVVTKKKKTKSQQNNITNSRLKNIQKIIKKFLTEKKMSKQEMAKKLEITVTNLDLLFANKISNRVLAKINIPLIKMYCSTKWQN